MSPNSNDAGGHQPNEPERGLEIKEANDAEAGPASGGEGTLSRAALIAIEYARMGIPVFPVSPVSKAPLTKHGHLDATTERASIEEWWRIFPDAMIGGQTGGSLWAVDLDRKNGVDGVAELGRLLGRDPLGLSRAIVKTPNAGYHLYFERGLGHAPWSRAGDIAPGVDTRGCNASGEPGAYIILPGSRNADGIEYEFVDGLNDFGSLTDAPRDLLLLATLSRFERELLAADPSLADSMRDAAPGDWQSILDKHHAARRKSAMASYRPPSDGDGAAYRLQARDDLTVEVERISRLNDGRHETPFKSACKLGKYVAHGFLTVAEIEEGVIAGCAANGGLAKYGRRDILAQVANGLRKAANDPLPPLARRFLRDRPAEVRLTNRAAVGAGANIIWPDLDRDGAPKGRSQTNVAAFLVHRGIRVRQNVFAGRFELVTADSVRSIDDDAMRSMHMDAERLGLVSSDKYFERVVLDIGCSSPFHPVRDYLDGLVWDGVPRIDAWLTSYLGVAESELTNWFGRLFLLAATTRILRPGAKFDQMLTLEGPQGCGKSTVARVLGGDLFTDAVPIGADSKEMIELAHGAWIVELAELAGLRRKDREAIKAMLSRRTDKARLAYGRFPTETQRQFVFIGTTNDRQYLTDDTGNRRFWPVRVGRIDSDALVRDRDQLWAEAHFHASLGASIELPRHLWGEAAAEQEARLLTDPWLDKLTPLFAGKHVRVATDDLWAYLGIDASRQDTHVARRLAAVMAGLGFEKMKRRRDGRERPCFVHLDQDGNEASSWLSFAPSLDTL